MRLPKYRKHSSRDRALVEIKGKRIILPGKHNSRESLRAYTDLIKANYGVDREQSAEPLPGSELSVNQLMVAFLREMRETRGEHDTEFRHCRMACRNAMEMFRDLPAKEFGPKRLKELRSKIRSARPVKRNGVLVQTGRTNSAEYTNGQINRIRKAFAWAVSEEIIPAIVHHALTTVTSLPQKRKKKKAAKWEHVYEVLFELSPTVKAMAQFQWYTGARSRSICEAKREQFDTSKEIWDWRPNHKSENTEAGRDLVLPIGPLCQRILLPFMNRRPQDYLFCPKHQRNNRRYRDAYDSYSYRQSIERAIKRVNAYRVHEDPPQAEIHFRPHQMRHAKGKSVRDEFGIEAAQAILGHGSISATQLYSERRLSLARDVARETG